MKKLLLISLMLAFTATCIAQKGKWKKAQKINTIESYQEFKDKYPSSEFSKDAKSNLIKLEFDKAKSSNSIRGYKEFIKKYPNNEFAHEANNWIKLKEQSLKNSYNKLKNYTIGVTTNSQFISDGWNASDPWMGNIGIVKLEKTSQRTECILGICASNSPAKAKEMNSMYKFADFVDNFSFEAVAKTKKEIKSNSEGLRYATGGDDVTEYIAALVFKNGILVSLKLY